MTIIYNAVKNVVIYLIFITVVMNLLGKSNYKKYVGIVTGIIFIIIVITPILELFQVDDVFDYLFESNHYVVEAGDMSSIMYEAEEEQKTYILQEYKNKLNLQIANILTNNSLYASRIDVEIVEDLEDENFGAVKTIDISASFTRTEIKTEFPTDKTVEKVEIDKITIGEEENKNQPEGDYELSALDKIGQYEGTTNGEEQTNIVLLTEIKVKTVLGDFYNIKTDNINISIRE